MIVRRERKKEKIDPKFLIEKIVVAENGKILFKVLGAFHRVASEKIIPRTLIKC